MKRTHTLLALCCCLLISLGIFAPLAAQDATATPADGSTGTTDSTTTGTLTNCDSSLTLLYGLASRYFGFQSTMDTGMTSGTGMFEYGQYTPFFDMSTMNMGTGDTSGTGTTDTSGTGGTGTTDASGTSGTGTTDASGTGGTTDTSGTGMTSSVMLTPPLIADENPSCIQLRAELETFFQNELATSDWDTRFRSGMGGMNNNMDTGSGG